MMFILLFLVIFGVCDMRASSGHPMDVSLFVKSLHAQIDGAYGAQWASINRYEGNVEKKLFGPSRKDLRCISEQRLDLEQRKLNSVIAAKEIYLKAIKTNAETAIYDQLKGTIAKFDALMVNAANKFAKIDECNAKLDAISASVAILQNKQAANQQSQESKDADQ